MSFSELDRTYIRRFVGFGAIFVQAEPRLENAITAVQSTADGGRARAAPVSTAVELRAQASAFREESARAALDKEAAVVAMSAAGAAHEHSAFELVAQVADCRNRRFAQWAQKLEEAAYELENP